MKAIKFGAIPFDTLKICYFKVYGKEAEPLPFFDATDEQILKYITSNMHETAVILRIENVNVLEVVTYVPDKRKLDLSELKHGMTNEEIADRDKKVKELKSKFEEK